MAKYSYAVKNLLKMDGIDPEKIGKPAAGKAAPIDPARSAEQRSDIQAQKDAEEFSKVDESALKIRSVQAMKDQEEFAEGADVPSVSKIRADAAKKQLQRYQEQYDQKTKARAEKQKKDQFYSDLITGNPDIIIPANAPDEEEKRLKAQLDRAQREADYWDGQLKQEQEAATRRADMAEVESWDEADREELERYIRNRQSAFVQSLNPALTGLPAQYEDSYLIEKYGRERLDEIARSYQREQNAAKYEQAAQEGRDMAKGGLAKNIGGNLLSVGANLADILLDPLTRIAQGAGGKDDRYSTLDPYAGGQARAFASGVREQTVENIEGEDPTAARKGFSYLYQGGMAAADSLARAAVGGSGTVGAGLAALGSFNQTLSQASAQGASPEQAYTLATINSGIEAATEKIPLDELFKVAKGGAKPAAQVVGNILKSAGIEAATEELSLIGTTLAEAAILQEKSGYNQQVMMDVLSGKSLHEAKEDANWALLEEAIHTAIVSGISGGISAGGAEIMAGRNGGVQGAQTAQAGQETETAVGNEQQAGTARDQEDSTAVNTDPGQHTPQEQAIIDDYQNSVDDNLVEYVETIKSNPGQKMPRYPLKDVSDRAASDIQRLTGIDVSGNKTQIEARAVEHILKRHGENGNADHSMRDVNDIGRIQHVIDNYDSMEHGGTTAAYRYQDADGKQVHAQTVLIKKKVNGTYFVVEAVPDTKKKTLYVLSAYMNKNGQKETASSLVGDAEAYRVTSETKAKSDTVLNNSIPQNSTEVNGKLDSAQQTDTQNSMQTGASNSEEQSAEGGQGNDGFEAMGAADQNFSGKPAYNATLSADNAQPDREGDVRPMELPQTDVNGGRISAVTGNVYGAGVTPDEFASLMEEPTAQGNFSYMPISNNQATQAAMDNISRYGWQDAYTQWHDAVRAGNAGAEMSARGALFLNHAAQAGDREQWLNVLSDFQRLGTNTAQGLQAFRILRNLAPSDRLYMIRRSVQQMVDDMHLRVPIQIDEQMADDYQNAQSNEEADRILDQIMDDVAAQIPSTAAERWTALRYVNMLGNLRTQVRNVSGNIGAKATYLVKDQIGAALEKAAHALDPNFQRTKSSWVSNDLKALGRQDFEEIRDVLLDGGRFDDARRFDSTRFAREVNQRRRIFNNRLLEGYRRLTNWAMNNDYFGDAGFARSAYARAFGGYLKANGFQGTSLDGIDQELLTNARLYAIRQAQESTFRDHNAVSDWVGRIGRRPDTPRAARALAEGIMPFRSTPANVLVRAEEYSPLGIVNTAVTAARAANPNSTVTGTDVVESLAKTMTGTGIFMLGMYLGKMGMLTGGPDPDEDKEEFDQVNGFQNYALQLPGGENITIDFLSPVAVPMFLGAEFEKIIGDSGYDLADFERVITSLADPLIQMSMLQGLNDTLDDIKYSKNNLGQFLLNASMSYLTQGLTNTLLGQIERSTEDTRKTTYVDKDSAVPQWLQRQLGKASQKIPGWDYQQTDYINARGETEQQRTDALGWLYNLTSPGYIDRAEVDEVSQELYRLHEAGVEGNVFPTEPETTLTWTDKTGTVHKDHHLTMEQADTLKREAGQTSMRIVGELVSSRDYRALPDDLKAKAIQQAYSYARETAEIKAIGDNHTGYGEHWMEEMADGEDADYILKKVAGDDLGNAMKALGTAWEKGYDEQPRSDDLKWAYETFRVMTSEAKQDIKDQAEGSTKNYIEARESGISHEKYVDAARLLDGLVPETGRAGVRNVQKAETIAGSKKLTEAEKVTLIKQQVSDSQDENIDQLQAMGYDVGMYARLYRDYEDYTSGDGKKKRTAAKWAEEYGISQSAAEALYDVFK